ncbi:insulinase family protein [Donghicola sp. XS_ASV15]|uniref:insulinase family protein n=1 Tax=Donghicola sp. XS_ASV15 TaxID=3241295 RepID=UPI0035124307
MRIVAFGVGFGLLAAALLALLWPKPPIYQVPSQTFHSVLVIPDAKANESLMHLVFPSGEAANPYEEGLAHYVEHLAFLSAFHTPAAGWDHHSNAWTSAFSTVYRRAIGPEGMGSALRELTSVAEPISLEQRFALEERDIVLREYERSLAEHTLYPALRDVDQTLYGAGGLSRSVIGAPNEIAGFSLDDARALHQQSHRLSQATLLIYGDVNKAEVKQALTRLPASPKEQRSVPPVWVAPAPLSDRRAYPLDGLTEGTFLYRKIVPLGDCGTPAECSMILRIAYAALDSTREGGLAGPLRFDAFIARRFSLGLDMIAGQYALLSFEAAPDTGVSLAELERVFFETLKGTLRAGLPHDTIERTRARIVADLDDIPEDARPSRTHDHVLFAISTANPIVPLVELRQAAETVSTLDVNAFLTTLLGDGREVTRLISVGG